MTADGAKDHQANSHMIIDQPSSRKTDCNRLIGHCPTQPNFGKQEDCAPKIRTGKEKVFLLETYNENDRKELSRHNWMAPDLSDHAAAPGLIELFVADCSC